MKFAEAKARINEIVKGDFFSMTFRLTAPGNDQYETVKCSCFTIGTPSDTEHGFGTKDHDNWEGVIGELVAYKADKRVMMPSIEGVPE